MKSEYERILRLETRVRALRKLADEQRPKTTKEWIDDERVERYIRAALMLLRAEVRLEQAKVRSGQSS